MKIIIVGGVAGGASAATRLRRLSETAEIVLFERGENISYANCGLPYYIGGTIKERSRLIVAQVSLLRDRFGVDVRVQSEVIDIDRERKTVTVRDNANGRTYEETYDKLLLSPGASPKILPIPGVDGRGVFTLRNLKDTFEIDDYITKNAPKRAAIIGGGFIGVEMAENLKERGLEVTLVEFLDQVLTFLDREIVASVHQTLRSNGIALRLQAGVTAISDVPGTELTKTLKLTTGDEVDADLVIMCTGVVPDSQLAQKAGLTLGVGNSILVDDTFRTSDPDIFAVGDAISVESMINGKEVMIPLAGPANKQGREAAQNMLGISSERPSGRSARVVQGSSVVKVFDMIAAATGFSEKQLIREKIEYKKTLIHPASHATYYPNATNMSMKMLFAPDGKILGVQAVGYDGVEKRVDVVATAMRLGATVYDLEELELCYAPPVSSAKDPVNMLGFTAVNILSGKMPVFYAEDADELVKRGEYLLDVSTPPEIKLGTIPGSANIPVDDLRDNLAEIPKDRPVYVFCRVGIRGYIATRILKQRGYEAYNLSGGYRTYGLLLSDRTAMENDRKNPSGPSTQRPAVLTPTRPVDDASATEAPAKTIQIDACGLSCPGPIMKVAEATRQLEVGEVLEITATDPAFASDIEAWCDRTGNVLLAVESQKGVFKVKLQKGQPTAPGASGGVTSGGNDKTMVVFSGDLDKAIASFIIANGAAAMGRKVTMFFTFWGLNILRRRERVSVKKNFIEKMFGVMMPRGAGKLGLSRMNMAGMGPKMIRGIMRKKNVQQLEELMRVAMENGVRVLACQMSMDLMGIHKEELIEGVELAGVATYLGAAELADTNLFI